jgi:site-specific recombinase XerD
MARTPTAAAGAASRAPTPRVEPDAAAQSDKRTSADARGPTPPATSDQRPATTRSDVQTPTSDVLLNRYLARLEGERNLSRFTLRNYTSDLGHYFGWLDDEGIALTAIARPQFRSYIAAMQEAGTAQGSVVRRVSTVKSFYRWLRFEGVMRDDPLALVHGPKQAKRLPHVLTLDDITNLIAAADGERPADHRDRALLEVMYAAGVRVSEAHGIDVADIDLDQRTIVVRGKGNRERLVVYGGPAAVAVERYLREGRPRLLKARRRDGAEAGSWTLDAGGRENSSLQSPATGLGPASGRNSGPGSQPLFVNKNGTRLSQRAIQLIVRKYALKAGLDVRVHPHLLRHTFATHLLDGGAELRVVQELLGHANPNTTQIYLHVTEERQRSVMESSLDELAAVEAARRALRRQ